MQLAKCAICDAAACVGKLCEGCWRYVVLHTLEGVPVWARTGTMIHLKRWAEAPTGKMYARLRYQHLIGAEHEDLRDRL